MPQAPTNPKTGKPFTEKEIFQFLTSRPTDKEVSKAAQKQHMSDEPTLIESGGTGKVVPKKDVRRVREQDKRKKAIEEYEQKKSRMEAAMSLLGGGKGGKRPTRMLPKSVRGKFVQTYQDLAKHSPKTAAKIEASEKVGASAKPKPKGTAGRPSIKDLEERPPKWNRDDPMIDPFHYSLVTSSDKHMDILDKLDRRAKVKVPLVDILREEYGLDPKLSRRQAAQQLIDMVSPFRYKGEGAVAPGEQPDIKDLLTPTVIRMDDKMPARYGAQTQAFAGDDIRYSPVVTERQFPSAIKHEMTHAGIDRAAIKRNFQLAQQTLLQTPPDQIKEIAEYMKQNKIYNPKLTRTENVLDFLVYEESLASRTHSGPFMEGYHKYKNIVEGSPRSPEMLTQHIRYLNERPEMGANTFAPTRRYIFQKFGRRLNSVEDIKTILPQILINPKFKKDFFNFLGFARGEFGEPKMRDQYYQEFFEEMLQEIEEGRPTKAIELLKFVKADDGTMTA